MRLLTALLVVLASLTLSAQAPAPAAPANVKLLTSAQVQQATLIKARAQELNRAYTDALTALEAAAAKLAAVKADQAALEKRATSAAEAFVVALGGDPKVQGFDWGPLTLKAPAKPGTP